MMQGVRTLAFRATPELADALTSLASRLGQSVGGVIREAVTQYITDANSAPMTQQQEPAPVQLTQQQQPRSEETVRAPIPVSTSTTAEELPKVIIDPPSAPVIAGPGALKAAGVEPVELTQRKAAAPSSEPDTSEQRWFKQ